MIGETINTMFAGIICGVITIIGITLFSYLKLLVHKARLDVDNTIIWDVEKLIDDLVMEANQTVVNKLKEQNGGHLPEDLQEKIFNDVKEDVMSALSENQLNTVISRYGSEDWIKTLIEKAVYQNHK